MSSPYVSQLLNGVCASIYEDTELMLSAISEKYDLPIEDLRQLAYGASDEQKFKSIKPQKRQPKRAGVLKKTRKPSGYLEFSYQKRPEAKNLLASGDESELTFKNKDGNLMTVNLDGKLPTFVHITQKIGSMWGKLSHEEKQEYEELAKTAPIRTKVQPKSKKNKGSTSTSASSSSTSTADESSDAAATTEEVSEKKDKPLPAKKVTKAPVKETKAELPAKKAEAVKAPAKKGGNKK